MVRKYHRDGTLPQNGEVFVFGSNLARIHGAGAAKVAMAKFGAKMGSGRGWQEDYRSYAIPTKDYNINTISLEEIRRYVDEFITVCNGHFMVFNREPPQFFVTRIGCGLAGYDDSQIAPMFKDARNCSFAQQWSQYLEEDW